MVVVNLKSTLERAVLAVVFAYLQAAGDYIGTIIEVIRD